MKKSILKQLIKEELKLLKEETSVTYSFDALYFHYTIPNSEVKLDVIDDLYGDNYDKGDKFRIYIKEVKNKLQKEANNQINEITKAIDIWQKNKVSEFISVITKAINDYKEE